MMKSTKTDWSRISLWLLLALALIIIGLAYQRIWKLQSEVRAMEVKFHAISSHP